jgi:hypothetical protein
VRLAAATRRFLYRNHRPSGATAFPLATRSANRWKPQVVLFERKCHSRKTGQQRFCIFELGKFSQTKRVTLLKNSARPGDLWSAVMHGVYWFRTMCWEGHWLSFVNLKAVLFRAHNKNSAVREVYA